MATDIDRRNALGEFLRRRRAVTDRVQFGLGSVRGRSTGLRREEVALLSGVSMTWYTWLEQARAVNPSRQVVESLCRVFGLDVNERRYVLGLAGYAMARSTDTQPMPESVQHLIDRIGDCPSYVIEYDWSIVGWNKAYEDMYPSIGQVGPAGRNLMSLIFTDPAVRVLLPDWSDSSRRFLSQFRADVGDRLNDSRIESLIARLEVESADFADGWSRCDFELFNSREREFRFPDGSVRRFEHHTMVPLDHPDLQIVVYSPIPED